MIPYENMVKSFMMNFDQKRYNNLNETPDKVLKLRASLIEEEAKEFIDAKTKVDQLDALCDLIYVVAGTAVAVGLRLLALPPTYNRTKVDLLKATPLVAELRKHLPCAKRIQSLMSETVLECREIAMNMQVKLDEAFIAIHENNMAKLWKEKPSDSKLIAVKKGNLYLVTNKDGKVIKPMGHKPPDLSKFI